MVEAVQVFAQQLHNLQAKVLILTEAIQKALAINIGHASSQLSFRCELVIHTSQGLRKTQDRSGASDFKGYRAGSFRGQQQTDAAFLHHINATAGVTAEEQRLLAGIDRRGRQFVQGLPKINVPRFG
jgi:hypothetical protein